MGAAPTPNGLLPGRGPGRGPVAGFGRVVGASGSTAGVAGVSAAAAARWAAAASCAAFSSAARASAAATSTFCALVMVPTPLGGPGRGLGPGRGPGPGRGAALAPACFLAGRSGFGASSGPGAPAGPVAAGALGAEPLLDVPPSADGNDSRSRRATGASTVEDADFTNSPSSLSLARTVLLSVPSSFASSWTRALPATGLLISRPAATRATSWLQTKSAHRSDFIVCSYRIDLLLFRARTRCPGHRLFCPALAGHVPPHRIDVDRTCRAYPQRTRKRAPPNSLRKASRVGVQPRTSSRLSAGGIRSDEHIRARLIRIAASDYPQ